MQVMNFQNPVAAVLCTAEYSSSVLIHVDMMDLVGFDTSQAHVGRPVGLVRKVEADQLIAWRLLLDAGTEFVPVQRLAYGSHVCQFRMKRAVQFRLKRNDGSRETYADEKECGGEANIQVQREIGRASCRERV